MREIRRKDRAIPEDEAMSLLIDAEYGVLSTVSEYGQPYGIPLSFCLINGSLYFHCAVDGQKIDHINHNSAVSFCTVGKTEILPDKFSTKYESVIVSGTAEEVFEPEKQMALEALVHKYASEFIESGMKYIDALRERTRVYRITINRISGKARRQ